MSPEKVCAALMLTLVWSCASSPPAGKKGVEKRASIETTEAVAFEAERQLNEAEKALDALDADSAVEQLQSAERSLGDSKIENYPEAELLKARHSELTARVPRVREEVARRKLAAEVKSAREKIDAGRAELKDAIELIKRRDPEESELKRAESALDSVRTALEGGDTLEAKDAEYAKFALSVRKDLAGQRKLVEQRRLAVAVDHGKKDIGGALAALNDSVNALKSKDVAPGEFDQARTAADGVDSAIKKNDEVAGKDLPFAKYVASIRERVTAARKTIADREHAVSVQRQRAKVEEGRSALNGALGRLKDKNPTDGVFEEADNALKGLEKVVEEGSGLAGKDRDYASYASGVKRQIDQATAKIAARRLEVTVAKKTAEITTARSAMNEALKRLARPEPTDPDFAEAKNAVGAVEKLLDGSEDLTPKDRGFSRFVIETRKTLSPANATIEKRKLEVDVAHQRAALAEALAKLKESTRRLVDPPDFQAAEAAVGDVEKTLEAGDPYSAKNPAYSKQASDGRKAVAAAKTRIQEQRDEVAMQGQKAKLEVQRETLQGALAALDGFSPQEETFKAADEAIDSAHKILDEGAELERRLPRYSTYANGVRKALAAAGKRVEARRLATEIRQQRLLVEDAISGAKSRVDATQKPSATGEDVTAAAEALKATREALVKGATLEKKDVAYEKFATAAKKTLTRLQESLNTAEDLVRFREGPVNALSQGLALIESAASLPPDDQKKSYESAQEHFRSCQKDAGTIFAEHPRVASASFGVGKKKSNGKAVLASCVTHLKSVDDKLAKVRARLSFYEGAAAYLSKATVLLEKADALADEEKQKQAYSDAATQFEECTGAARLLLHEHPELKKERFEIEGRSVTLPVVLEACQKGAKRSRDAMRGKK